MFKKILVIVCTVALLASLLSGIAVFAEETNLIKNPDISSVVERPYEGGNYLWATDWEKFGGSYDLNYRASNEQYRGLSGYSIKIFAGTSYLRAIQHVTNLVPGKYYELSAWYYATGATDVSLLIRENLEDFAPQYTVGLTNPTTTVTANMANKWNRITSLVYVPEGKTEGYVSFQVKAGGVVYCDDFSLTMTKNILTNGDMDTRMGISTTPYPQHWERMGSGTATMGTNAVAEEVTANSSNFAMKLIGNGTSATPRIIHKNIPLKPSTTYRITLDFTSSVANDTNVWWKIAYYPSFEATSGLEDGSYFPADMSVAVQNQWETKSYTFTTKGTTNCGWLYLNVKAANVIGYFDNIVIEEDYTSVGLYNSIGNKITTASAGETIKAKGHFVSTSPEVTDGLMVVGLYEVSGSTLKLVNIQSAPATSLTTGVKDVELPVTIPSEPNGVKYCVKAFAWDGFSSLKPYADIATVTQVD